MSDEIREQEWKAIWESQEFQPPKQGWERMERALSEEQKPQAPVPLVPWWSWRRYGTPMAAAVVLGLGMWSVWQRNSGELPAPDTKSSGPLAQVEEAPAIPEQTPVSGLEGSPPSVSPAVVQAHKPAATGDDPYRAASVSKPLQELPAQKPDLSDRAVAVQMPDIQPLGKDDPSAYKEVPMPEKEPVLVNHTPKVEHSSVFEPINNPSGQAAYTHKDSKPMSVGLAANIGKPNLGNVQYNVGVVLRKEWSDAFFTEASVSMAATDIRYAEDTRYGISYKSGDMVSSEGSNAMAANTIGETRTVYGNNIMGVGLTPMLGYKVTKQVSLAVGVDVYRNFNTSLNLYYNSDIADKAIKDVDMVKNVSAWDSGLKGRIGLQVSKAMSVQAQYRQGLNDYIRTDNKTYKQSLFNIGFIYSFQP